MVISITLSAHQDLSVISKLFETIINKMVVDYLNRNNLLTADILTVISHGISKALDNKYITKTIPEIYWKPLTWGGLGVGVATQNPTIIVNGQFSEAQEIKQAPPP